MTNNSESRVPKKAARLYQKHHSFQNFFSHESPELPEIQKQRALGLLNTLFSDTRNKPKQTTNSMTDTITMVSATKRAGRIAHDETANITHTRKDIGGSTDSTSVDKTDILQKVQSDLQKETISNDPGSHFFITQFIAEEMKNLPDCHIPRYLYHRYRYDIYPKEKLLDEFPPYVQIEPASNCNYRCVFCYQIDKSFSEKTSSHMGLMPLALFKSIINEIEGRVDFISLASRGEPLLNPEFPQMLHYCKGKFLGLKVNTNASLLDEKMSRALLCGAAKTVVFSADAADPEEYKKYRQGGNLAKIVDNIRAFRQLREREYPNLKLITRVSGVKVNEKQNLEEMITLWSDLVDQVSFVNYNPWESIYQCPPNKIHTSCSDLWRRLFVWFDGIVNPCDSDYKSSLRVGHFNNNGISKIWRGHDYERLRETHSKKGRQFLNPCNCCVVV